MCLPSYHSIMFTTWTGRFILCCSRWYSIPLVMIIFLGIGFCGCGGLHIWCFVHPWYFSLDRNSYHHMWKRYKPLFQSSHWLCHIAINKVSPEGWETAKVFYPWNLDLGFDVAQLELLWGWGLMQYIGWVVLVWYLYWLGFIVLPWEFKQSLVGSFPWISVFGVPQFGVTAHCTASPVPVVSSHWTMNRCVAGGW